MTARTILLVNGDRATRRINQTMLEQSGFAVFQAASGSEAPALVPVHLPDVVAQELRIGSWTGAS